MGKCNIVTGYEMTASLFRLLMLIISGLNGYGGYSKTSCFSEIYMMFYRKIASISSTKSQNLNDCRLVLFAFGKSIEARC